MRTVGLRVIVAPVDVCQSGGCGLVGATAARPLLETPIAALDLLAPPWSLVAMKLRF